MANFGVRPCLLLIRAAFTRSPSGPAGSESGDLENLGLFCPPLLKGRHPPTGQRHCLRRQKIHSKALVRSDDALRALWIEAMYNPGLRARQQSFLKLLETVRRLDCFGSYFDCFSDVVSVGRAIVALCRVFRRELDDVFAVDMRLGILRDVIARNQMWGWMELDNHTCFSVAKPQILWPENNTDVSLIHESLDVQFGIHSRIERYANTISETSLLSRKPMIYRVGRYNLDFRELMGDLRLRSGDAAPLDKFPMAREFELSASRVHSPGGICGQADNRLRWTTVEPLNIRNVKAWLKAASREEGWVVNVGAGDGLCDETNAEGKDHANCLFRSGRGGVMFEGGEKAIEALTVSLELNLHECHDRKKYMVHQGYFGPLEVARSVVNYAVAHSDSTADFVKVDVDNCDCCFVEAVLSTGIRPRLISLEINSWIPPPIAYRPETYCPDCQPLSTNRSTWKMLHCSLSAVSDQLSTLGYELITVDFYDALFARIDTADSLRRHGLLRIRPQADMSVSETELMWREGFYCHPRRVGGVFDSFFQRYFIYDTMRWYDVTKPAEERMELIRAFLDHWQVPTEFYRLYLVRT